MNDTIFPHNPYKPCTRVIIMQGTSAGKTEEYRELAIQKQLIIDGMARRATRRINGRDGTLSKNEKYVDFGNK